MDTNEAIVVLLIFGSAIIAMAVVFLLRVKRDQQREESALRSLEEHKQIIEDLRLRLSVMFKISRGFVQAENERAIIELVLSQAMDVTGAAGASFVPLDERGQPLGAIRQGDFPFPLPDAWLEYLASPSIRQQCNACKNHGNVMKSCPLLNGPLSQVVGLYCLPLRRKDLDLGVLNLYLPDEKKIVPDTQDFLHSLIDETALALEGVRLRSRELAIIRQSQAVRQRVDLPSMLNDLLVVLQTTVGADYILLAIEDYGIDKFSDDIRWEQLISVGIKPVGDIQKPLSEFMQKVYTTGEEYANERSLGEDSKADKFFDSLIVLPLKTANKVRIGVMLAGKREENHFQERQQMIIRTISGQIALVVENTQIMNELQYKMMAEERGRLAREIHDGSGTNIGFLEITNRSNARVLGPWRCGTRTQYAKCILFSID